MAMRKADPGPTQQNVDWWSVRAELIGAIKEVERIIEASGQPIESAIVTRQERRSLTRRIRKRNI